jgi:hypothetical protein
MVFRSLFVQSSLLSSSHPIRLHHTPLCFFQTLLCGAFDSFGWLFTTCLCLTNHYTNSSPLNRPLTRSSNRSSSRLTCITINEQQPLHHEPSQHGALEPRRTPSSSAIKQVSRADYTRQSVRDALSNTFDIISLPGFATIAATAGQGEPGNHNAASPANALHYGQPPQHGAGHNQNFTPYHQSHGQLITSIESVPSTAFSSPRMMANTNYFDTSSVSSSSRESSVYSGTPTSSTNTVRAGAALALVPLVPNVDPKPRAPALDATGNVRRCPPTLALNLETSSSVRPLVRYLRFPCPRLLDAQGARMQE